MADCESDCEPDSQNDPIFDDFSGERLLEDQPQLQDISLSLSKINQSRTDTSFSSQQTSASTINRPGFKKYPVLIQVYDRVNNNQSICKFCHKIHNTREMPRLLKHVEKCKKMDKAFKSHILDDCRKKTKVDDRNEELNLSLAMFMTEVNLSFSSVHTESFQKLKRLLDPGWRVPDRKKLSNYYVPILSTRVKDQFYEAIKLSENHVTLEFDHWQDANKNSILGTVFTLSDGTRYLEDLIDVSLEGHSASATVRPISRALLTLKKNGVNAIISDSASACELTRKMIVEKTEFRTIIQHRCLAHFVNRMGTKFSEDEHLQNSLAWASKVACFVSSSTRLCAILKRACQARPKKICKVRCYSTVNMVESLLSAKSLLLDAINDVSRSNEVDWITDENEWMNLRPAINILRPIANCIAVCERKVGSLGESVTSILRYARDIFRRDWSDPLTVAAITSFLVYFGEEKLDSEFGLILASYVLDRRNKCDFVTVDGLDLAFQAIAEVAEVFIST